MQLRLMGTEGERRDVAKLPAIVDVRSVDGPRLNR